jgi:hypothetical protein
MLVTPSSSSCGGEIAFDFKKLKRTRTDGMQQASSTPLVWNYILLCRSLGPLCERSTSRRVPQRKMYQRKNNDISTMVCVVLRHPALADLTLTVFVALAVVALIICEAARRHASLHSKCLVNFDSGYCYGIVRSVVAICTTSC